MDRVKKEYITPHNCFICMDKTDKRITISSRRITPGQSNTIRLTVPVCLECEKKISMRKTLSAAAAVLMWFLILIPLFLITGNILISVSAGLLAGTVGYFLGRFLIVPGLLGKEWTACSRYDLFTMQFGNSDFQKKFELINRSGRL